MFNLIKKQERGNKKFLKFSKKIISVFVIFILLSTLLSTIVSSDSTLINRITKDDNSKENLKSKISIILKGDTLK